jgi:hypothetical protein
MAARHVDAARSALEELVTRYPKTPHAHYARGVFFLTEDSGRALEEFPSRAPECTESFLHPSPAVRTDLSRNVNLAPRQLTESLDVMSMTSSPTLQTIWLMRIMLC